MNNDEVAAIIKLGNRGRETLDEDLSILDAATTERRLQEAIENEFNLGERKATKKQEVTESARLRGETLTPDQADAAVEGFFNELYRFREPPKGIQTALADLYVDRTRIGKKYGVPAVIAAAAVATIWMTASVGGSIHRHSLERQVEVAVEKANYERGAIADQVQVISVCPITAQLPKPEQEIIRKNLELLKRDLEQTGTFFAEYCPKGAGSAKLGVTQENYEGVRAKLTGVEDLLKDATTQLKESSELITTQQKLTGIKSTLDSLVGEIKGLKPLPVFLQRAENLYNSGIAAVGTRRVSDAEGYANQLTQIRADANNFTDLTGRVERAYADVIGAAKEKEAKTRGERLYQDALQSAQSANVQALSSTVEQLETLRGVLNKEYTLRIVSRPGVRSGVERDYTRHYVVLEAIASNGEAIPMDITNEETGSVERVTMWAEKVEDKGNNSRWERVKRDKNDNNVVDDNIVGYKKKGYLNEQRTMDGFLGGKITHW